MITLITGTPGAGKTAWIVAELLKIQGRALYVDGIPELQISHEVAGPLDDWMTWAPDGALIVVDECQRIWRPRGTGSKVPESVSALETHRHRGLDFWLITQHPNLLDANVRRLVSRHIHLTVTWAGRHQFEWPECQGNPERRGTAVKRPYKLPPAVFDKYKSATIHTKIEKRRPVALYVGIGAVVGFLVLAGVAAYRIDARVSPTDEVDAGADWPMPTDAGTAAAASDDGAALDFRPRVAARPETAPAYDALRVVKDFPRIAGCARTERKGCKCFTQQATDYPVPLEVCEAILSGAVFDPYIDPAPDVAPPPAPEPARAPDALAV
ncbi:MAG: zonular occludens toxin [Gammaproteobacteria bacterium]|nr:zonular occludens toxin [Gammaproteobacteria bacterium]